MEVEGSEEKGGIKDQDRTCQARGFSPSSFRNKMIGSLLTEERITASQQIQIPIQGWGKGFLDHLIQQLLCKVETESGSLR